MVGAPELDPFVNKFGARKSIILLEDFASAIDAERTFWQSFAKQANIKVE